MSIILKMLNNWYFVTYFWTIILRYFRNSCTIEFLQTEMRQKVYFVYYCFFTHSWCAKINGAWKIIMKSYFIDHSASNFKAFLSDTKYIILIKTGKKASLIFPISVIWDFQYVILHIPWVLTIPNMLVLQFVLGSAYIGSSSTGLLWQWWKMDL